MIEKVRILRFGQFVNREFELGPVTIFVGPNEAGKTTVFDALIEGICAPSEATIYGKRVKQRYGDRARRIVELEPSPAETPDVVEFLNVQAFESGAVSLVFSGKNWIERLRGTLFTGGLNPNSMADQLRLEENRERKVLKKVDEQLVLARRSLADLQANRLHVLQRRASLKGDEETVSTLAVEEAAFRAEIERIEAAVVLQRNHSERRRTVGLLERIAQFRRNGEEVERFLLFDRDCSEEIAATRRQVVDAEAQVAKAEAGVGAKAQQAEYLIQQAGDAEVRGREAEGLGGRLAEVQARLERAPRPVEMTQIGWSIPLLVVAGALALAGVAAALALRGSTGTVMLTAGIAAGVVAAVLARKQRLELNTAERDRFVEARRAELAALLKRTIAAAGTEGLAGEIAGAMAEARTTVEAARAARGLADQARRDRDDATAELGPVRSRASQAAAEVARLFQTLGVVDEEDLGAKRAQQAERRRTIDEAAKTLVVAQAGVGAESVDQLETLQRARLAELDRAISGPELIGEAARLLEPDLAAKRQALDAKVAEQHALAQRLSGQQGELRATLGKIPEEIAVVECRVANLELDRKASSLATQADAFAASVFDTIAQDTQATVQLLAAEATSRLATVLGRAGRLVDIGKLEDPKTFAMTDAGGESRSLDLLSRGTRDALLFAVRLALAETLDGGLRVLLLDDPFGALDPERIRGLLTLLDEFRKRADFQLIFFTKEPAFLVAVKEAFKGLRVHDLGVAAHFGG